MESLGSILKKIAAKNTRLTERRESSENALPTPITCPRCNDFGWVQRRGANREVIPCRCNPPKPIGQGRGFDTFKPIPGTQTMVAAAQEFVAGTGPPGLTIVGKNGCGKTHIMEAIANAMHDNGRHPGYIFLPDFLANLRSSFEPESDWKYSDLWKRWSSMDVLLLDDLKDDGRPTPWAIEQVERIVDVRYRESKPYVVSTNGTLDSIMRGWSRRLADRIFDERSTAVRVVYNTAISYRTGKA